MMSGRIWAGAVMVRSRNRSSCSSAVTNSADDWVEWVGAGATCTTDDKGCWCSSCGDGGTNAVTADAIDSIVPPTTTTASDVATSDAGAYMYVFIFRGKRRAVRECLGYCWQWRLTTDFLTEAV